MRRESNIHLLRHRFRASLDTRVLMPSNGNGLLLGYYAVLTMLPYWFQKGISLMGTKFLTLAFDAGWFYR
jgi:hypothetical protein